MKENVVFTADTYGVDSSFPTHVASEADMAAILANATTDSIGRIYKYTGISTENYEYDALYIIAEE